MTVSNGSPRAWKRSAWSAASSSSRCWLSAGLASTARAGAIAARGRQVGRIGALRVFHGRNATPADAIRVFGPARTLVNHGNHCKLTWPSRHLTLDYWSYGGVTGAACQSTVLQDALAGRSWRTAAGLNVGDTLARLKHLYRHAVRVGGRWALLPYPPPFGPAGTAGSPLWAVLTAGRVSRLLAFVGDAGE